MKLKDLSTSNFVKELAGSAPAPGGGSVAAFAGAMAAGLCAMVARLTACKTAYREAWEAMDAVIPAAEGLSAQLIGLMDTDTEAYNKVVAAFRLPKESDDQKKARSQAIQSATRTAAEVPLATLRALAKVTPLVEQVVARGNPNCITDAGTAVHLLQTAAMSAAYNVRINIGSLKDRDFASQCSRHVRELAAGILAAAARLAKQVDDKLG